MLKKGMSMLLAIVMLFSSVGTTCFADPVVLADKIIADNSAEIQPMYTYTNNHYETLSISNGIATCKATLNGISGTTTKVVIEMVLQKKTLLWWSEVETWNTTHNTYYSSLSKTASVGSGTYRVKAVYTVYSGSNSESITGYSNQQKY